MPRNDALMINHRAFFALVSVLSICTVPARAADPVMFRGDAQHTGVYHTQGPTAPAKLKWKLSTGGYVLGSPAVADGTVYIGSADGYFYAVDASSGALKWKRDMHDRIASSPAVANGLVYFTNYDSYFYALDAADGRIVWRFKTGGERRYEGTHIHGAEPKSELMPDPFDVYLSSPALAGDAVYFGSGDGDVYALNPKTGALLWKFKTGDVVHASPAVSDGVVYIGSWDSRFYALDAATGKERWHFKTGEDPQVHNQVGIQSSAAVAGGMVYFGCRDSHLYALDARTGREKWDIPTHGSWVITSPAIEGDDLYFATSDSGLFDDVDAQTGAVRFSLDFKHWPTFSSPAIAGRMLYVGSHAGVLRAIDLDKHVIAWSFVTDGAKANAASLTSADGTPNYLGVFRSPFYDDIVVGADKMMATGAIYASPAIVDGVVYFGSTDGNLYAIQ